MASIIEFPVIGSKIKKSNNDSYQCEIDLTWIPHTASSGNSDEPKLSRKGSYKIICKNGVLVTINNVTSQFYQCFQRLTNVNCDKFDWTKKHIYVDWLITHTWKETTCGEYKFSSVFVNLETGQVYETKTLSEWKGSLNFSPDGKMVIIECSIIGSAGNRIHVVDISNLPSIEYIYSEEFGYSDPEPQVSWSIDNEFVCVYKFVFEEFQGKIVFKPEIMQKDELYGYDIIKEYLGIKDIVTSVTVNRTKNNTFGVTNNSILPTSNGFSVYDIFGNNINSSHKNTCNTNKTEFGTFLCGTNKMIEVSRRESENFNDYFRFYMKK